ncbi:MAG: RloB domain-containing protein [Spirochaetes bacterium]|nr:MAG: RloB domain-containing protein [Spirochaetota bacterium]RKX93232.1 MAG: RloB domain-containing protein [Spirochaetota bacterium]
MVKKAWEKHKEIRSRSSVASRKLKETFLIVCEGTKTEPNYFDSFRVKSATVKTIGSGRNTISLVEDAINIRNKEKMHGTEYDQVWCVFDRDDFHSTFNDAVFLAGRNGLKVAFSNESFELWYLLHFIYFDSNIGRAEYIKKLKKHLGSYEKNDKTVYEKIIQKQSVAIRNAQRLISSCDMKNPNKCEPCTTVVNLVGALNRFL